jgi:hypothetical protein
MVSIIIRNQNHPDSGTNEFKLLNRAKTCTAIFSVVILAASYGLTSCQKVISIDLNSASPQLVVEADVSDQPGPYFVRLSNTVNFSEIKEIPAVTGAAVEISDSSGSSELLKEVNAGIYQAHTLIGVPGHTYRLTVKVGAQTYESVSKMPYPVGNLSLELKRVVDNGRFSGGGPGDNAMHYVVNYEINDPAEYKNYYRFVVYYKNGLISSHRVFDDQFHNGKIIADDFELRDSTNYKPGDTIMVELQSIGSGAYNFFRTLRAGAGGLSFLSASPSNPISNISNNALGYFNVCSVTDRILVIPEK